jgi:hypothetical protein
VNKDEDHEEEEFTIHKRALSDESNVGTHTTRKKVASNAVTSSPWKPSWNVLVRDMYLYDFKFHPPSTVSQQRQFRQWLKEGTHDHYQRWLNEPLGTIEAPEDLSEWIYHSPTRYI